MECLWGLYRHRYPDGDRTQPHSPVFYVHFCADDGLTRCCLPDLGLLAQPDPLHPPYQKKSLAPSLTVATRRTQYEKN